MLEVSSVGVDEEDEIELSLGLSIGGIFRKTTESKQIDQKPSNCCEKINSLSTNVETDLSQDHQNVCATQTLQPESEYVDPQKRREIHALRRQEARKKREEKLKRGLCRGMNGGFSAVNEFSEDKMWLEAQRLQIRVTDREMRENEVIQAERACKQGKSEECIADKEAKDLNLTLNYNGALNQNQGLNTMAYSSSPSIPVLPVQYPIQYVPYTNGFAYPYMMPCWAPTAGKFGNEKNEENVFQPVACRSFRPYSGNQSSGHNLSTGYDSEHISSKDDEGSGNAVSNGSPVGSSSALSGYQSKSQQGGSSSDTSHSCYSQPEYQQLNALAAGNQQGLSELGASSNLLASSRTRAKATNTTQNLVSSNITQSGATQPNGKPKSETQPDQVYKPIPTSESQTSGPLMKGDMGKPPKPQTQNHDNTSLRQMPCVSTTGNGPNGKTITGFLYRYTKTEVSIICVCHGSSFSPAEFVEHAGSKDIIHPLRHITVIPSALDN